MGADGSSVAVAVGGIGVGRVKPGFVGGRVDVTKTTGVSAVGSADVFTHAVKRSRRESTSVIFFIICFLFNGPESGSRNSTMCIATPWKSHRSGSSYCGTSPLIRTPEQSSPVYCGLHLGFIRTGMSSSTSHRSWPARMAPDSRSPVQIWWSRGCGHKKNLHRALC